jgi:hypothetical protein
VLNLCSSLVGGIWIVRSGLCKWICTWQKCRERANLEAVWGRFGQESRSFRQQRQFHARYANRAKPHEHWRLRISLIWASGDVVQLVRTLPCHRLLAQNRIAHPLFPALARRYSPKGSLPSEYPPIKTSTSTAFMVNCSECQYGSTNHHRGLETTRQCRHTDSTELAQG